MFASQTRGSTAFLGILRGKVFSQFRILLLDQSGRTMSCNTNCVWAYPVEGNLTSIDPPDQGLRDGEVPISAWPPSTCPYYKWLLGTHHEGIFEAHHGWVSTAYASPFETYDANFKAYSSKRLGVIATPWTAATRRRFHTANLSCSCL